MFAKHGSAVHGWWIARFTLSVLLVVSGAQAQTLAPPIAGENVNMVSGTEWPGGDPFLQRQNEPSLAVSTKNPNNLLAGANDYRTVDVASPEVGSLKQTGDAWSGVFKSKDGGQTWKSNLLPGYPQWCRANAALAPGEPLCDVARPATCTDAKAATCELRATADPVVRAGTDGMIYYGGINFSRDKTRSRIFVARFVDANNSEAGDPISRIDTRIVATAPAGWFVDKPWMAVDVPRTGALKCTIPADAASGRPALSFPAGTVWVGWAQFAQPDETRSDVMLSYSRDCGATWAPPIKLNTANSILNQGVAVAIEPISGRVYVSWRRFPSGTQIDAIMATRSAGRSRTFATPRVAAVVTDPFEQGASEVSFRTEALPTMAISSDGKSSWAHIAWQQRKGNGDSRIVMTTALVFPPPPGDQDADDPETSDKETRVGWQAPVVVDDAPLGDDVRAIFDRGHQFMPALTFGQGRLMLVYYDSRLDHTRRYYAPTTADGSFLPDPATGRFYKEELAPVGDRVVRSSDPYDPAPGAVFNAYLADVGLAYTRHTIDVRVTWAPPGPSPHLDFAANGSTLVSRFPFGMRGDEPPGEQEPSFAQDRSPLTVTERAVAGKWKINLLQQLQMNPPNLPMFASGTRGFIGDYIDVQGVPFVPRIGGGGWDFNIAPTSAPLFHAVWTSNQDVKPPLKWDGTQWLVDWTIPYTPVSLELNGGTSVYDGSTTRQACSRLADPTVTQGLAVGAVTGTEGSRDQNIYTSRITEGLLVTAPQNAKPLPASGDPATFVILVQNTTPRTMSVSLRATTAEVGVQYSFAPFGAGTVTTLTATIPPLSSISRTLFAKLVTSTNQAATFTVTADERCPISPCRSGTVTLNPPVALATLIDALGGVVGSETYAVAVLNPNITNPNITNPNITNPNITNPNITNPNITNPNITNPNITNPNITNPNITNPNITNPNITNPNITNPNITNPNITNPNITNPNITNPNITNATVSDLDYEIRNGGNTTTSYRIDLVNSGTDPSWTSPQPLQLIVTKTYTTVTSQNCALKPVPHDQLVVSIPDVSGRLVNKGETVPAPGSGGTAGFAAAAAADLPYATVSLAPGESAKVTLRALVKLDVMAKVGTSVIPAVVPDQKQDGVTQYEVLTQPATTGFGLTRSTTAVAKVACDLTEPAASECYQVTVSGAGGTPTGWFFLMRNGVQVAAGWTLSGGNRVVAIQPQLGAGDTLVAFYQGDATYAPSLSVPVNGPSTPGALTIYAAGGGSVGYALAADAAGSLYLAGSTQGAIAGVTNPGPADARSDLFLVKVDSVGHVVWQSQFGVLGNDLLSAVAVGPGGVVYATGNLGGQGTIVKHDAATGAVQWREPMVGAAQGTAVAVDPARTVLYVAGARGGQLVVQAWDYDGHFVREASFGASVFNKAMALALDPAGNLCITGIMSGAMAGTVDSGGNDVVVAKLDPDLRILWLQRFGSAAHDFARALAVDALGNVYVGGQTYGSIDVATPPNASGAAFLAKLGGDGTLQWVRQHGSTGWEAINSLVVGGGYIHAGGTRQPVPSLTAMMLTYDDQGNYMSVIGTALTTSQDAAMTIVGDKVYFVGAGAAVYPGFEPMLLQRIDIGGGGGAWPAP